MYSRKLSSLKYELNCNIFNITSSLQDCLIFSNSFTTRSFTWRKLELVHIKLLQERKLTVPVLLWMNSINSSILERRETLLKSIRKKKEGKLSEILPEEDDRLDREQELKPQVYDSIHALVRMGYDFETILKYSNVKRAFLEQLFHELKYCKLKPDLEIITNDENSDEKSRIPQRAQRSVEVEIQLFVMRIQLEVNKLSAFLDQKQVRAQLQSSSVKKQLESKRQSLINSMNDLFDKVIETEHETAGKEASQSHIREEEKAKNYTGNSSNLEAPENASSILVDSGFVKIAKVCGILILLNPISVLTQHYSQKQKTSNLITRSYHIAIKVTEQPMLLQL